MMLSRFLPPSALVLVFAGCASAPTAPLPDPLPEVLEWARPELQTEGAFIGIEVRENDTGSLEALSFEEGVRVTSVASGSPATKAGLRAGDVLLTVGDVRIDGPGALDELLAATASGTLILTVRRGDAAFEVEVQPTFGEGPALAEPRLAWVADPSRSRAGWLGGRGGVVLVTQDPDGPFAKAGVREGDVVVALDGERVRSERSLVRAFLARPPGKQVLVTLSDGDEERDLLVDLFEPEHRITEATLPILAGYRAEADGSEASFYLVDLWFISLFKYRREGEERSYSFLRWFEFSSGVGELSELGS